MIKNKNKILYFETNILLLRYTVWSREINYLKQQKETAGGNSYYIDYKCKALISAFCIAGNFVTPPTITEKKWSKEVKMFLINHDMHSKVNTLKLILLFNTE